MATNSTPNYTLVKPIPGTAEPVSVQAHLDDNWDKVDAAMNKFDVQVFPTNGTWNKPAGCKRVIAIVQGDGGSGGACAATAGGQAAVAGGGGGGGYAIKTFLASALASSETVTVGQGGTAPAAGLNNGINGTGSSFATGKAYVVTGNGGVGGIAAAAAAGTANTPRGIGGTATGGDVNVQGGDGGNGMSAGGVGLINNFGGSSVLGNSANTDPNTGAAVTGRGYGSGSSGAYNAAGQPTKAGIVAAPGVVVVYNYY
jgi:hypothetical protein